MNCGWKCAAAGGVQEEYTLLHFSLDGMNDGNLNTISIYDNQSVQWLHLNNILFIAYYAEIDPSANRFGFSYLDFRGVKNQFAYMKCRDQILKWKFERWWVLHDVHTSTADCLKLRQIISFSVMFTVCQ